MAFTRRELLQSLAGAAAVSASAQTNAPARRPNILLILADDMGFSDIGCYGSEIDTPNLDRLASGGVRFSEFYNCARCCPSRACLLTGLYPHQAGMGHMVDREGPLPGYANDLSPTSRTIAEVLKPANYRTAAFGKWHVTPVSKSKHNWPLQRGFDQYYGIIAGAADYFNPGTLTENNESIQPDSENYYFTDALGDRAAKFVADSAHENQPAGNQPAGNQPWFAYVPFTAPHWPLQVPPDAIEKYRNRYRVGWDRIRTERHEKQLAEGLVQRRWDLTPRDERVSVWKDEPNQEWEAMRMAVYAAIVDRLDHNIGKILDALRRTNQEENTLVLFMSDNGGCAEEILPSWKNASIPPTTRSGAPVRRGNIPGLMPGPEETYESYGLPWANASNTPFRMYKHWVHEGGISTPLIARWPARIRPSKTFISEPCHFIDIAATCCDIGGATYPSQVDGQPTRPLQGKSLIPLITGSTRTFDRTIFWEHEGNHAARHGQWKMVRKFPDVSELYDIAADRTELHDLAIDRQKIADDLTNQWNAWAKSSGVLDWFYVQEHLHARKAE